MSDLAERLTAEWQCSGLPWSGQEVGGLHQMTLQQLGKSNSDTVVKFTILILNGYITHLPIVKWDNSIWELCMVVQLMDVGTLTKKKRSCYNKAWKNQLSYYLTYYILLHASCPNVSTFSFCCCCQSICPLIPKPIVFLKSSTTGHPYRCTLLKKYSTFKSERQSKKISKDAHIRRMS